MRLGVQMATLAFQDLEVYQVSETLCDKIWAIAKKWPNIERDTLGKQIIRSADSIGANIAEGNGRGSYADQRRFLRIARGSFNETRHWLRRAYIRKLLTKEQSDELQPIIESLGKLINGFIRSIERMRKSNTAD